MAARSVSDPGDRPVNRPRAARGQSERSAVGRGRHDRRQRGGGRRRPECKRRAARAARPDRTGVQMRSTWIPACLAASALVAAGCGGTNHSSRSRSDHSSQSRTQTAAHRVTGHRAARRATGRDPVLARLGLPPLHGSSPLPGDPTIADRDNNRIIIVNPQKQIVWRSRRPARWRRASALPVPTMRSCPPTVATSSPTRSSPTRSPCSR